jgi:tetratricopeptide (TPR) repeat protein
MGSMRFRKSMKLGPGVRLNASKTGLGMSFGPRGARYSVHSSGRRTASVGLPGSGLSYRSQTGGRSRARQQTAAPPLATQSLIPKAGMLAPGYEKAFAKGVRLFVNGQAEQALAAFEEASAKDEKNRAIADDFFAGLVAAQLEKQEEAVGYLEKVVASPIELPDPLMTKYIPGGATVIGVTPEVNVRVEFGSTAAALALAELYQGLDRREEAIGVLQQLVDAHPQPALVLSLAELLSETEAWDEVVELTAGTKNEDDITLAICIFQGRALEEQGMEDAAIEVYREALRARKRDEQLLKQARYQRGRLYLKLGKNSQARKDLGRVYADDPGYEDVAELLK